MFSVFGEYTDLREIRARDTKQLENILHIIKMEAEVGLE
jgi:hypothetical protein